LLSLSVGSETEAGRVFAALAGRDALEPPAVRGPLRSHHLFHAVRASFLREPGRSEEELAGLREADALAALPAEKEFIAKRIKECGLRCPPTSGR